MRRLRIPTLGLILLCSAARAEIYNVQPGDDLWGVMRGLQAGDEVIIHGGAYPTPGYVMLEWRGAQDAPIIVRAAEGTTPVIEGDPSQNAMNITGAYFQLIGLEITRGSHGLRLYDVHDALLEDLHVHHTGEVAVSANIPDNEYHHVTFRGLHLHHTGGHGEGLYLGCNEGGCGFHDNVIEGCWIHDTHHDVSQGDGIEIKQGGYGNVIRDNIIHDTQYPCIIVYGTQGNPPNVIERNALWRCGDSGIQAAADALIQNNVIVDAGNGINSHTHQGAVPANLIIRNNTILNAADRCIRGSDWGDPSIELYNNAIYCEGGHAVRISPADQITAHDNVLLGAVEGLSAGYIQGRGAAEDFMDVAGLNLYPTADSPLRGAAVAPTPVDDFDGISRGAPTEIGALHWEACRAEGRGLAPGFKASVEPCGAQRVDAGPVEPIDAGPVDPVDAGVEPEDSAVEPVDGEPQPSHDATTAKDSASPAADALTPQDSTAEPDWISPQAESGVPEDLGGAEPSGGSSGDGCQVNSRGGSLPLALMLALLSFCGRRRRA